MIEYLLSGFIGLSIGLILGFIIQAKLMKPLIGDDFEINRPKVKGENNLLQVLQNNKKESKTSEEVKKKRFKIFKRKNKK